MAADSTLKKHATQQDLRHLLEYERPAWMPRTWTNIDASAIAEYLHQRAKRNKRPARAPLSRVEILSKMPKGLLTVMKWNHITTGTSNHEWKFKPEAENDMEVDESAYEAFAEDDCDDLFGDYEEDWQDFLEAIRKADKVFNSTLLDEPQVESDGLSECSGLGNLERNVENLEMNE